MKLRMRSNSIRLRLTQSDVAAFEAGGAVEEIIEFGLIAGKRFTYRLEQAAVENVCADFADGKITVSVPLEEARNWVQTNQIGIKAEPEIGNGKTLKILIEKDFACLDVREGEDESDAFPHPNSVKSC